jgi:hypothetical protein
MPDREQDILRVIDSITVLLGDEKIQETLKDQEHYPEALQELTLPDEAWKPLLHLLTRVECLQSQAAGRDQPAASRQPPDEEVDHAGHHTRYDSYEKTQLEAFDHIRAAFWISIGMSVGLFLVGLGLTGFAIYEATLQTSVSASALTIGGLGLADFVLLFFRRPWQDISVDLSNSQQVRTITTTYLVGLALIQRRDNQRLQMLDKLTKGSVERLQQYTEERDGDSTQSIPKPESG